MPRAVTNITGLQDYRQLYIYIYILSVWILSLDIYTVDVGFQVRALTVTKQQVQYSPGSTSLVFCTLPTHAHQYKNSLYPAPRLVLY